jgi:Flp pilus assembly protein TadG
MTRLASKHRRFQALLSRLARSRSGVAYVEFAYTVPVMIAVGCGGIEATNLAMAHMQISQVAISMADNASRIGQDGSLSSVQFREIDVVDSFAAALEQAGKRDIMNKGRVVLSSLERNSSGGQWIHWQRCLGKLKVSGTTVQSAYGTLGSYGTQGTGATGTSFTGMGIAANRIQAPASNAVMFVEITYQYEPLLSSTFFGTPLIKYEAAFIVRDKRDLTGDTAKTGKYANVYNPSPAIADASIGFC